VPLREIGADSVASERLPLNGPEKQLRIGCAKMQPVSVQRCRLSRRRHCGISLLPGSDRA